MRQALGLIETVGLAAAIEAADTAVKAADVTLIGYEMTRGGGMITVKLMGDVGAVKAAVTAGVMSAKRVNDVFSSHVIPRPHGDIEPLIANIDRGPGHGGGLAEPVPLGSDGDGGAPPAAAPEVIEEPEAVEEPEPEAVEEPEPEAFEEPEPEAVAEPEPEAVAEPEPGVIEEPEPEPEAVAEPELEAEVVEEPEVIAEPELEAAGEPFLAEQLPLGEEEPVEELLAVEEAPRPQRCRAMTQAGTRCRHQARPGTDFCHIHEGAVAAFDAEEA